MQLDRLKVCIKAKFGTEANMARRMNWPRQRLNKITTGRKVPDVGEIGEMATALEESITKVAEFFLA